MFLSTAVDDGMVVWYVWSFFIASMLVEDLFSPTSLRNVDVCVLTVMPGVLMVVECCAACPLNGEIVGYFAV